MEGENYEFDDAIFEDFDNDNFDNDNQEDNEINNVDNDNQLITEEDKPINKEQSPKPIKQENIIVRQKLPRPNKQQAASKTTPKPRKATAAKPVINIDWKSLYDNINVPDIKTFATCNIISTIMWLLKNCHRDADKLGKIKIDKSKDENVENITLESFKQMIKLLYNDFVYVYKLHSFINIVNNDYKDVKLIKHGLEVKQGNKLLFTIGTEDEYKQINKRYKLTLQKIYKNIDLSKLSFVKMIELFKLPIFSTCNAYELPDNEFDKFGFAYDDREITIEDFNITQEQKTVMYHEIFSKLKIDKPFEIFNRRISFIDLLNDETINNNIDECVNDLQEFDYSNTVKGLKNPPTENNFNDLIELLQFILSSDEFKNIMFKGYSPNPIIKMLFDSVFKSKEFKLLLNNYYLYHISYLFGPTCFWNDDIKLFMKDKESQALANRRKLMINYLLTSDDVAMIKNNYWWVNIINNPSCLANKENIWCWTNSDSEKEAKREKQRKKTDK